jgi:hypothetical protein
MMDPANKEATSDVDLPPTEILRIVSLIHADKAADKKARYQAEYSGFANRYPNILEMVCKPNFYFARFEQMLELKTSVDRGAITQHDASVKVGSSLFNTYVKGVLPK